MLKVWANSLYAGAALVLALATLQPFASIITPLAALSGVLFILAVVFAVLAERGGRRLRRWMPLDRALRYLVYDTKWALEQPKPGSEKQFDQAVVRELREALARGDIPSRGRTMAYEGDTGPKESSHPIDSSFWTTAFFQPHAEIVLADSDRCTACVSGGPSYRGIVVDGLALRDMWPPRSKFSKLLHSTPISEAVDDLRRQIAAERKLMIKRAVHA